MRRLALGSLSDGRLQLWCTDVNQLSLYTCWKEHNPIEVVNGVWKDPAAAAWMPWRPFPAPPEAIAGISDIAALQGPDGRLTLWCASNGGEIFMCRKSALDPGSEWTSWSLFVQPPILAPNNLLLTAVYLPNQCTQLFVSAGNEGLWSITQLFNSTNQDVDSWSNWEQFSNIETTSLASWGLPGNGIELFQYTAGSGEVFKFFIPDGANQTWQTDGYPFTISPESVTAIIGLTGVPNTLQFAVAQTDNNGGGHVRQASIGSDPPNSSWSTFWELPWGTNPVDCFATGQLQNGTGQWFASSGDDIMTCWAITAGGFWTFNNWVPFQTPAAFYFPGGL